MTKLTLAILLGSALLLLAACDSGGEFKFRVINNTSFPLYVNVADGPQDTIAAGGTRVFDLSSAKQRLFNPDVEKEVPVRMIGETYQIAYETETGIAYTDSTSVTIQAGKTLSAYISPNRASFKVVNNSSRNVERAILYSHNFVAPTLVTDLGWIPSGESKFACVNYATNNNTFYYLAQVKMESDSTFVHYGSATNILEKDQQFLITLTDPE